MCSLETGICLDEVNIQCFGNDHLRYVPTSPGPCGSAGTSGKKTKLERGKLGRVEGEVEPEEGGGMGVETYLDGEGKEGGGESERAREGAGRVKIGRAPD